ncbi:ACT1 [Symbiodinium sp. KB8]|nr:ACT1 [Symbiodinium sp. KB8]
MLDAGLVLYLGLLVLFLWRFLSGWRLCGAWLEYANYCMLLYLLLLVLNTWAIYAFLSLAFRPEGQKVFETLPPWMRPLMLGTPAAAVVTYFLAFIQTGQHVNEIRRGSGALKHDRAVQIIALPAVFGCTAMNALTKVFQGSAGFDMEDHLASSSLLQLASVRPNGNSTGVDATQFYTAQVETCYQVGDLYEAWALYQFCKMTLEILKSSLEHIAKDRHKTDERRVVASGLLVAHKSLADIAYTGVIMFLVVCCAQAGWSLYLLTFTNPEETTHTVDDLKQV